MHASTVLGSLYVGTAAVILPQASHSGLEQAHSLLVTSLLADADIKAVNIDNLSSCLPNQKNSR